jgi:hypothetical protein
MIGLVFGPRFGCKSLKLLIAVRHRSSRHSSFVLGAPVVDEKAFEEFCKEAVNLLREGEKKLGVDGTRQAARAFRIAINTIRGERHARVKRSPADGQLLLQLWQASRAENPTLTKEAFGRLAVRGDPNSSSPRSIVRHLNRLLAAKRP